MTEIRGILMYEVNTRKVANMLQKHQQRIAVDRICLATRAQFAVHRLISDVVVAEIKITVARNTKGLIGKLGIRISAAHDPIKIFQEAVNILSIEPDDSEAGAMASHGRMILGQLSKLTALQ
ncbi:hypothetical protein J437_LFUL014483 [Ladona fulva]|uniref:Uncharacterized protein n=1 Tax=Ladona fulva TaxID=123851 RepID=A0A8K0P9W9_LADFU|nr:hypothetical protein J437_LFUL014483 [Ladona fulva]